MSANAPAGSATRKIGRLVAVCTSATIVGDGSSAVMSHTAPTFCIQVPTYETTDAIHRARNSGSYSGCQGDIATGARAVRICADSVWRARAASELTDT